ncbi:uncharacterized protein LAESUDRAFT_462280 [Laetiporus sulphureus 93-53]|uniref:Uncharacterized protein n=1 Tax=Laetiporus sulphureus 93-53 TaxID=1314785 RepID=A0A165G542_9APHY|nr:uncharacterized protein LAESUDRAFT_462280 [Laetiporus sulphureus 93-53]KZT09843.1 hypothetical protein LAESUDRAFT_462280 [Laetiporus sulphureus 93-53]
MTDKAAEFARLSSFFSCLASGDHRSISPEFIFKSSAPVVRTRAYSEASIPLRQAQAQANPSSFTDYSFPPPRASASREKTDAVRDDDAMAVDEQQPRSNEHVADPPPDLSAFAKRVADVLMESKSKYQPLPTNHRRRNTVTVDLRAGIDPETLSRNIKRRRTVAPQPDHSEDHPDGNDAGDVSMRCSSPSEMSDWDFQVPPSPATHGRQRTLSLRSTQSRETVMSEDAILKVDEEKALNFVSKICQKRLRQHRRQMSQADLMPPPPLPSEASPRKRRLSSD